MNAVTGSAVPKTLRAVIFDLDGTLIDTADEFIPAVQTLRAENGLPEMEPERIRATVSNGARALVSLGLGLAEDAPAFEAQRLRLLALYRQHLGTAASLYPGMAELLQEFSRRDIRWGICTNKPRAFTEPLLQRLAIEAGSVVCPEDVTNRKPHPESLYLNCRELQCAPSDAVFIGDHARDIEAGRRAGMFTIAAAYGYIVNGDAASRWGASASVERSEDLHALIFG